MNILLFVWFACAYSCDKFIRNKNLLNCKDCVYFRPRKLNAEKSAFLLGKCNRFYYEDMTQKTIIYEFATECRNDENKCGKGAKYFTPNDNMLYKMSSLFLE
jgi:hypothetical protein